MFRIIVTSIVIFFVYRFLTRLFPSQPRTAPHAGPVRDPRAEDPRPASRPRDIVDAEFEDLDTK